MIWYTEVFEDNQCFETRDIESSILWTLTNHWNILKRSENIPKHPKTVKTWARNLSKAWAQHHKSASKRWFWCPKSLPQLRRGHPPACPGWDLDDPGIHHWWRQPPQSPDPLASQLSQLRQVLSPSLLVTYGHIAYVSHITCVLRLIKNAC